MSSSFVSQSHQFQGTGKSVLNIFEVLHDRELAAPWADTFYEDFGFGDSAKGGKGGGSGSDKGGGGQGKPSRNESPVAQDDGGDGFISDAGAFTTASILDNDSDPNGDQLTVIEIDTSATRGTVTWLGDGTVHYDPAGQFAGLGEGEMQTDTFTYTIDDGRGGVSTATVTIDILGGIEERVDPTPPPPGESLPPPYYVEALLAGDSWRHNAGEEVGTPTTVTFAFADMPPDYYEADSFVRDGFTAFSVEDRDYTRMALEGIADSTGLTFTETDIASADIVFGAADLGRMGFAYYPSGDSAGAPAGDVWLDTGLLGGGVAPGGMGHTILLHEIGHALGLSHTSLSGAEGTLQYSVTAAQPHPDMSETPETMQLHDLAALQYLYGKGDAASGDTTYGYSDLADRMMTISDDGGHDVIDLSAATEGVIVNLEDGSFSSVGPGGTNNVAIAFDSVIEDAIGSDYGDVLSGNDADNALTGGLGADRFGLSTGVDRITDFEDGVDLIDLGERTLADLTISTVEGGTLVEYEGGSVLLDGLNEEDFDEMDFVF